MEKVKKNTEVEPISLGKQLAHAARRGDVEQVNELLEAGAPVEGHSTRYTPLTEAVRAGSEACVESLIKAGANVHARDLVAVNAALLSISKGHEGILRQLIKAGVSSNDCELACWSVAEGQPGCLKTLIAEGFDPKGGCECGSSSSRCD